MGKKKANTNNPIARICNPCPQRLAYKANLHENKEIQVIFFLHFVAFIVFLNKKNVNKV